MAQDRQPSDEDLEVTQDLEIDRICVCFERQLTAGNTPSLESTLDKANPSVRGTLFRELLLLELEHQRSHGANPEIEEYLKRFSDERELVYSIFVEHLRSRGLREAYPVHDDSSDRSSAPSDLKLSESLDHGRFVPGTKLVDRYRIVSRLGKGGMGEVYRADDLKLGHAVALKFLTKGVARDPKRLEYFYNEVRLSRQISHPNVCRVYDIAEAQGEHFLSMEYIDGEDLRSLLRHVGRFPKDRGIEIARQLCAGLAAAHDRGVLHRDLKPANPTSTVTTGNPLF